LVSIIKFKFISSSPELKAPKWAFLIACFLLTVHLSVHLSLRKLFSFLTSYPKPQYWVDFNHTWHKSALFCSSEAEHPSPREDNSKTVKKHSKKFKNLLLHNQEANFNQIWYKSSTNKGNLSLINFQRGEDNKNAKIGWGHLRIFSSRITGPESFLT
jgi:hypothetical protein